MSSSLTFERKFFVKDLFQPKDFLNQFNEIEFESFQAFLNAIGNEFLSIGSYNNYVIINNIDSEKELKDFNSLISDCNIDQEICIHLNRDFILKNMHLIKDMGYFSMRTNIFDDDEFLNNLKSSKDALDRFSNTKFELVTPINYENYKHIFSLVLEIYNKGLTRFFDFKFDYMSIDQMTLSETREFEFRYKDINHWKSGNKQEESWDFLTIADSKDIYKPIYVSNDLKTSLSKQSFENGDFVFDLGSNINSDGESIEKTELNKIRQYIDLKIINSYFPIMNSKLINYYHNYLLEGSIDEIPLIGFIILGE